MPVKIVTQMTVRDEEFYIEMALKSVVSKSYGIYVLDTGSSDGTVEVIKVLQKKYSNIVLEEKHFGGIHKWDITKWEGKIPIGYREADARNYTDRRAAEEFPDFDWILLIDGDEVVNDNMFDEVDAANAIGASMLGHSTILPMTPTMALNTKESLRFAYDELTKTRFLLFDPHFRAWTRGAGIKWEYNNHNHIVSVGNPPGKSVSRDDIHFHLHYAFGPKAIHGWLCKWTMIARQFAESVGIPPGEWDIQRHYEERFQDWFVDGKFKPKKELLREILAKCVPIKNAMPDFVVEKWKEWGDYELEK